MNNWYKNYVNFLKKEYPRIYLEDKKIELYQTLDLQSNFDQIFKTQIDNMLEWLIYSNQIEFIKSNIIIILKYVDYRELNEKIEKEAEILNCIMDNIKNIFNTSQIQLYTIIEDILIQKNEDYKLTILDMICNNFERVLKDIPQNKVIEFLQLLRTNNKQLKSKIQDIIKQKYIRIVDYVDEYETFNVLNECNQIVDIEDDIQKRYSDILKIVLKNHRDICEDKDRLKAIEKIIKELAEHEKVKKLSDIKMVGKGQFSYCLKIGEYVFKIGICDVCTDNEIPYDPRILQPIIRRPIPYGCNTKCERTFIEISNYVDMDWAKGLTEEEKEEEVYKIYKEMRGRGIICEDIKPENIGRLLKPNKVNYDIDGKELEVVDGGIGMKDVPKQKEILPAGELVIIDTNGYIYKEKNDSNDLKMIGDWRLDLEFAKRYQQEKLQKEKKEKERSER